MNQKRYGAKTQNAGLQCLLTVASYYGIPMDIQNIRHEMCIEENVTLADMISAAKKIGFKAKVITGKTENLDKIVLPVIFQTKNEDFIVAAKKDGEKVLVLYPFEQAPKVISVQDLEDIWNRKILLLAPRKKQQTQEKFGFRWFLPSIIKYKGALFRVILAAFIMQILSICSPLVTQSVIDKVLVHNSLSTLDVLSIALIAMMVFETILSVVKNYILIHTTSKIDVILSSRLMQHLFSLPLRYFEKRRIGDTVARIRELENIRRFLTGVPLSTTLDCMFLIVYLVILFFYSAKLTGITLLSLPFLIVTTIIVTPMLKARLDEQFNCGAESQSYLVEAVTGIQTIKSFAIEPTIQKKWENLLADYVTAGFRTSLLSGNAGAIARMIQRMADIAILWVGAIMVMTGDMTIGQLVAFRMIAARVNEPIMRLVQLWQEFQQTNIAVQRIGDIFNTKPEIQSESNRIRLPNIQGNIRFQNVTFAYEPQGTNVIQDMSFRIPAHQVVGIVGRSGSGKSTISKLVQRLYFPQSGKIMVDGVDIATVDPVWLRRQIGVVLQENFLFNATIRENIALHHPSASMEEIVYAAKIAGAHEFIIELEKGYDTIVGEKGLGLSGGQKQRIAIARALLCNPKILIFDEATSALDYESESIIQRNLREICKGRTVLIIAHRLSTLKDADAIMVVEKGKIAEYGSKEKLVEARGLFWHLLKQQGQV